MDASFLEENMYYEDNVRTLTDIKAKGHILTKKGLKDFLDKMKNLPDDTPVLIERVTDFYFEPVSKDRTPWSTIKELEYPDVEGTSIYSEYFSPIGITYSKKYGYIQIYAHF